MKLSLVAGHHPGLPVVAPGLRATPPACDPSEALQPFHPAESNRSISTVCACVSKSWRPFTNNQGDSYRPGYSPRMRRGQIALIVASQEEESNPRLPACSQA